MTVSLLKRITRARRKKADPRAIFAAFGVTASLLLLAFVLQRTLPDAGGLTLRLPAPEFTAFLPAEASQEFGEALEIAALPQSSYVIAYSMGGSAYLALVSWDREESEYALASTVQLSEDGASLDRVAALSLLPMGAGDPLIVARGPFGATTDGTFALARDAGGLGIVRLTDDTGMRRAAFFITGVAAMRSDELWFEDVDSDGRKEAFVTHRETTDGGVWRTLVEGYRFGGGEFTYDKDLSRLLTITKSLFPEPDAE